MTNIGVINFNSGEVTPEVDARKDIEKYTGGCRTLENMIPDVFGNAVKRPGTEFIAFSQAADIFTNFYIGLNTLFGASNDQNIIAKFLSGDGGLNPNWGTNGGWGNDFPPLERCFDLHFTPDGSVVLGWPGSTSIRVGDKVAKLDSDGILDTSFAIEGFIGSIGDKFPTFRALVVDDNNGDIFVATNPAAGVGGRTLTKYDSGGSEVPAFADNGIINWTTNPAQRQIPRTITDLKIQDDNIYISGDAETYLAGPNNYNIVAYDKTTGVRDTLWSTNGFVHTIDNGASQDASTMQFDSTGRMYVNVRDVNNSGSLYRLGTDGLLDTGFIKKNNESGNAATPTAWNFSSGKDMIIDSNGNIWAMYRLAGTDTWRLKKYDTDGAELLSIEWTASSLVGPRSIIEDNNNIYIGSGDNLGGFGSNILKYSKEGVRDESFTLVTGHIVQQMFPTGELRD